MKIIITGSLGNISKPLVEELVQKGHLVTVISSNPEKQRTIETLGATAAIGALESADFLAEAFKGADAVYCMVPPALYSEPDRVEYYSKLAHNYAKAIEISGTKRVVHLSTYGADLSEGTGLILGAYYAEQIFNQIQGISLTHLRPAYFYYNLYAFTSMIRKAGKMFANYGEDNVVMVSPKDIASAVAEELVKTTAEKVRYVASDARTGREIASVLGNAIGKPNLQWEIISDETAQQNLEANGFQPKLAADYTEMLAGIRNGKLTQDFSRHQPEMGKVKLEDFAKEFAAAFQQN